jgi:hypothetical protein
MYRSGNIPVRYWVNLFYSPYMFNVLSKRVYGPIRLHGVIWIFIAFKTLYFVAQYEDLYVRIWMCVRAENDICSVPERILKSVLSKTFEWRLLSVADNFGRAEGKHCFGACAAVRLLSWRWELLPEQKTLPATQRTVLYTWPHSKTLHSKLVLPTLLRLLPRARERWYDPSTTATVTSNRRKQRFGHRLGLALSIGPNWVGYTWRWIQNPVAETSCFKIKTGRWIVSRNIIFVLMYHRHELLDRICSSISDFLRLMVDGSGSENFLRIFAVSPANHHSTTAVTYRSPLPDVCNRPNRAVHYHIHVR